MRQFDDHNLWLWPKFDAYVKRVVRASNYSYIRMQLRNRKVPTVQDSIIMAHMKSHHDNYPSDHFYIFVDNVAYSINDPALFNAMQQLPDNLLKVLVLKFWHQESEKEIAQKMNVTIRSCYSRRKKALALLKATMERKANEGTKQ